MSSLSCPECHRLCEYSLRCHGLGECPTHGTFDPLWVVDDFLGFR